MPLAASGSASAPRNAQESSTAPGETPGASPATWDEIVATLAAAREAFARGERARAFELVERTLARAASPRHRSYLHSCAADFEREEGRDVEALARLDAALAPLGSERPSDRNLRAYVGAQRARVRLDAGLLDLASRELAVTFELLRGLELEGVDVTQASLEARHARALLDCALEDYSALERGVREALARPEYERHPVERARLVGRFGLGLEEAARLSPGRADEARALLERALTVPELVGTSRVRFEVSLADLALRARDYARAADWLAKAEEHAGRRGVGASRDLEPELAAVSARLERLRTDAPASRETLARARDRLAAAFAECVDRWRARAPRRGGYGVLQYADVQALAGELMSLETSLARGADGVERSLVPWFAAGDAGSLMRLLAARGTPPAPTTLARVQAELITGSDHAILAYFPSPDAVHVHVIRRDVATHAELALGGDALERSRIAAESALRRPASNAAGASDRRREALDGLAATLFPPHVQQALHGVRRLSIVGLDVLGDVPFEALPYRTAESSSATLGTRFAVDHLPSFGVALVLAERARRELAAGAAHGAKAAARSEVVLVAAPASSGIPLAEPAAVDLLRAYAPERRRVFFGSESRSSAFGPALRDARLLQVVTHGRRIAGRERPGGFVLEAERGGVEVVGADEVEGWDAPPLVVLSVCGGAYAPRRRGDAGSADLAGALFIGSARTRCVVVTAFDLDVETARALSSEMHAALAGGADPAEALRRARAALAADPRFADPFHHGTVRVVGAGHVAVFDPEDRR